MYQIIATTGQSAESNNNIQSPWFLIGEWGIAIAVLAFAVRELWKRRTDDADTDAALTAKLIEDIRKRESELLQQLLTDVREQNQALTRQSIDSAQTMLLTGNKHLELFDAHMRLMKEISELLSDIRENNKLGFSEMVDDLDQLCANRQNIGQKHD